MRFASILLVNVLLWTGNAFALPSEVPDDEFFILAEVLNEDAMLDPSPVEDNRYASGDGTYSRIEAVAAVERSHCKPQSGEASWYGGHWHGRKTANGEIFNTNSRFDMTAAHRTLPMGTRVRVTNRRNGLSVIVRINDRGPFIRGRIIDVSRQAARELGIDGVGPVQLTCL